MRTRRTRSGTTLVELMVSMAFLAIVLTFSFGALQTTGERFSGEMAIYEISSQARMALAKLSKDLAEARILSRSADHSSITVMFPVDADGDGGYLDADGNIAWGVETTENWTATYAFVSERTLSESYYGKDFNRDGDTQDTFMIGGINQMIADDNGVVRAMYGLPIRNVAVHLGAWDADFDGDGNADPMFMRIDTETDLENDLTFDRLRIAFWLLSRDSRGEAHLFHLTSDVNLRNPQ